MSGDVQPRKRKEKRRKKDDEDTGTPPPILISPTDTSVENITIHIYKESSTGGHWCARIIFFILLAVLVGLIGIIIFEHRGTTDVDTPIASSRWASIFEGWVDDSPSNHDDVSHKEEMVEANEKVLNEEKEKEGNDEEESTETEKQEEEENIEQEEDEGIGEEEEEGEKEEEEEGEEEEEEEEEEEGEKIEEEEQKEIEEEPQEGEKEEENEDENEDEGIDEENVEEEDNKTQQEYDDTGTLEETDETNEYEDEIDEGNDNFDMELEASMEIVDNSVEEKNNDISEEFADIPGIHEIDDNNAEPLEEIESEEREEDIDDVNSEPEEEEIEEESTSVAMKFGVGVALVVAAHFVLVRRWNNVNTSRSPHDTIDIPDLSRRNTIVPPPHIKKVIKSAENVDNKAPIKAQVKNYEDLRFKYMELQKENISLTDINNLIPKDKAPQVNEKWSTQSTAKAEIDNRGQFKIISSEEEEDYELETSESEHVLGMEEYYEEQMEENNDDHEEEEEEEEEGREEEEEDEEIENVDDSELIAKLEAKYGKLSTLQDSEAEEEEDEEEEEEEEEEETEEEEEEEEEEEKEEEVEKKKKKTATY